MDVHLKSLADASLEVAAAETSVAEEAFHSAGEQLDAAALRLADLRAAWPDMSAAERIVVGPSAASVRVRLDAARAQIPRLSALSVGAAVSDPEEEQQPD
jgi:hypothetical protein